MRGFLFLTTSTFLFNSSWLSAQTFPNYANLSHHLSIVNPAYSGSLRQWEIGSNLSTIAPKFIDTKSKINITPRNIGFNVSMPIKFGSKWHSGIDLNYNHQVIGFENNTLMKMGYNKKIYLADSQTLSLGLQYQNSTKGIAFQHIYSNPIDTTFPTSYLKSTDASAHLGAFYYSYKRVPFYAGISFLHVKPEVFAYRSEYRTIYFKRNAMISLQTGFDFHVKNHSRFLHYIFNLQTYSILIDKKLAYNWISTQHFVSMKNFLELGLLYEYGIRNSFGNGGLLAAINLNSWLGPDSKLRIGYALMPYETSITVKLQHEFSFKYSMILKS